MPRNFAAYIKAFLTVVFWGASFVAIKITVRTISPVTLVWTRFAIGVVILGATVLLRHQFAWPQRKDWFYFALLGFIGITFHQWLQSTGLVTSAATTTGWIVASMPIFIAILGWLILKEKLTWPQAGGILLAALGVALVITRGDLGAFLHGKLGGMGDVLILLSAPNWAIFTILSRRGLKTYPAALMMFYVMLFGWVFSSVLFVGNQGWESLPLLALDGWLAVAFLGILCSGVAYIFWYDALKVLPVARVGTFLYIEPVVTVIVAAIVLGEEITLPAFLGGLLILGGVWLVNRNNP
jgi:drug/metabolite transporter (DMT)-like permease